MAITFLAGALQGFSGFGYSLLALPLLCVFVPARWAVPVIAVSSLSLNAMVFITFRRNLNLKGFLPMAAAYIPGAAAGGIAGIIVSGRIDSSVFGKAVLVILSLLGVFGALQALV